jgi:transcriptional regulator with XRE-family HTH domain
MDALGINDSEFANRVGWTRQQVSQYMNRHRVPSLENIDRIAEALETTPAWLISGEKDETSVRLPPRILQLLEQASPAQLSLIQDMLEQMIRSPDKPKRSPR